ncbi:7774_t:CDS:2, partial [Cetraspora pellucida]
GCTQDSDCSNGATPLGPGVGHCYNGQCYLCYNSCVYNTVCSKFASPTFAAVCASDVNCIVNPPPPPGVSNCWCCSGPAATTSTSAKAKTPTTAKAKTFTTTKAKISITAKAKTSTTTKVATTITSTITSTSTPTIASTITSTIASAITSTITTIPTPGCTQDSDCPNGATPPGPGVGHCYNGHCILCYNSCLYGSVCQSFASSSFAAVCAPDVQCAVNPPPPPVANYRY